MPVLGVACRERDETLLIEIHHRQVVVECKIDPREAFALVLFEPQVVHPVEKPLVQHGK
ncbi:hypothetical protein D3C83_281860 [compost metagenome]